MTNTHRTRVRVDSPDIRSRCTCGWVSNRQPTVRAAIEDGLKHVGVAVVPALFDIDEHSAAS